MEYEPSDSSGTDNDLPPSHQSRFIRPGHVAGNGRSALVGSGPFSRVQNDMETLIHNIEQEAYTSVLRAFKAQSDAISWEKESLITELRKELRVSDEEHRELLSSVNADDIIHKIREWRKARGLQPGTGNSAQQAHDHIPSPTVSASRKKQKTSQSLAPSSLGAPSPAGHPSMQPSSSALRRGPPGAKTKKPKSFPSTVHTGRTQAMNETAEAASYDPLIGKKVWTRWPEDNHFYEAVITDYNSTEGRHALVYDMNTTNETWEWVNLKELLNYDVKGHWLDNIVTRPSSDSVQMGDVGNMISPDDIRWEGEDTGMSRRGGRPGSGRGTKKSMSRGGAVTGAGRGRGTSKGQPKKDFTLSQNGGRKKPTGDIEILHTDSLIKEVEHVFGSNHPDPTEMERAKNMLKEHEQALVDAIARLEDASDGESGAINGSGKRRGETAV